MAEIRGGTSSRKIEWNRNYEELMIDLLASSVKIRPAIEVGRKAVEYFRASDAVKWILKNEESLRQKFPVCFPDQNSTLTNKEAQHAIDELVRFGFIYKALFKPLGAVTTTAATAATATDRQDISHSSSNTTSIQHGTMNGASTASAAAAAATDRSSGENAKIPKWPRRLEMAPDQKFDINSFYILRYEPKSKRPIIYLALLIGLVFAVCLFPAWPLALKLSIWYISVILITFILGSTVVRLIFFILIWYFGVDFWIFPNLFNEELGVIDSFKPFYAWERRKDGWTMFAARIFLAILMIATVYQLSQTHSISDIQRFAAQQFLDVLDWGHQKLAPPGSSAPAKTHQQRTSGKQFSSGMQEVEEDPFDGFKCLIPCGFESYDVLKDECLFDCNCMKEVLNSHCFKKCTAAARVSLEGSAADSCKSAKEEMEEQTAEQAAEQAAKQAKQAQQAEQVKLAEQAEQEKQAQQAEQEKQAEQAEQAKQAEQAGQIKGEL